MNRLEAKELIGLYSEKNTFAFTIASFISGKPVRINKTSKLFFNEIDQKFFVVKPKDLKTKSIELYFSKGDYHNFWLIADTINFILRNNLVVKTNH
ncbi:MAG: hypothetical protein Q8L51_00065 [Candidatus Amesbacteria bacterium]|nr:hypothetical protein [Candidatus Amesbacteria bacterium]